MSERISYKNRNQNKRFKMSHAAITYNVTVNHFRRILSTTSGHPATVSGMTKPLLTNSYEVSTMDNLEFELFELFELNEKWLSCCGNVPRVLAACR
jgi:hypothetical protein